MIMSFSYDLKTELSTVIDPPRHCRIAELSAILWFLGTVRKEEGKTGVLCYAENSLPLLAASELCRKLYGSTAVSENCKGSAGNRNFRLWIPSAEEITKALKTIVLPDGSLMPESRTLTQKSCCKRAFLRGAFLSAGTISDPERSYHIEINCRTEEQAEALTGVLESLHIPARTVKRGRYISVYNKDSEQISDILGLMGARVSLLELENKRILRSMRGAVNRKVNCETANINKTATASARQIEDIRFILEHARPGTLSVQLDEVARIRVEYPEATLQELGEMLDPPVGKSGINHRLRKLSRIAEDLRNKEERE